MIVLLRRRDGKFAANPAGINSMLFYHATIIIHGTVSVHVQWDDG